MEEGQEVHRCDLQAFVCSHGHLNHVGRLGTIKEYTEYDGQHRVVYDDGDVRWYTLSEKTFWLEGQEGFVDTEKDGGSGKGNNSKKKSGNKGNNNGNNNASSSTSSTTSSYSSYGNTYTWAASCWFGPGGSTAPVQTSAR